MIGARQGKRVSISGSDIRLQRPKRVASCGWSIGWIYACRREEMRKKHAWRSRKGDEDMDGRTVPKINLKACKQQPSVLALGAGD